MMTKPITGVAAVRAALSVLLSISALHALAQEQDPVAKARVKEAQAMVGAVYAAVRGRSLPVERPFGWSNDFFKGDYGTTYVPFTLTIDRSRIPSARVAMHIFVTPHRDPAPRPAGSQKSPEPEEAQPPTVPEPETAYEEISFVDLSTAESGTGVTRGVMPVGKTGSDAYRLRRAFSLSAGDYDVYVALAAGTAAETEQLVQRKTADVMVIKQQLSVPDLWTNKLSTSSLVVAERVEPLNAPLSPEQRVSDPYTLGTTRIVPANGTDFRKTDELAVIFFVYNAGLTSERKPDVTVEYLFHQRSAAGERYVSRTAAQSFNARTMPGFDINAGHQLIAGQAVPLQMFREGEYRLEIKVTDETSGSSLTRDVNFTIH